MRDARPHPGPLPQGSVNHPPCLDLADTFRNRPSRQAQGKKAAVATVPEDLSSAGVTPSLSPGERDGVRASVIPDFIVLLLVNKTDQ